MSSGVLFKAPHRSHPQRRANLLGLKPLPPGLFALLPQDLPCPRRNTSGHHSCEGEMWAAAALLRDVNTVGIERRSAFRHLRLMARRKRSKRLKSSGAFSLSLMLAETFWSSVQTISRRTRLMAEGRCTAAEHRRMVLEKSAAAQESAAALARLRGPRDAVALLAPWHRRAKANARRLVKSR